MKQKHKIGFLLLLLAGLIPVANGLRVFFVFSKFDVPQFFGASDALGGFHYYLARVGPVHLVLNGLVGLANVCFMIRRSLRASWWVHLVVMSFVGGLDAAGAIIFHRSYQDQSMLYGLLPSFVTLTALVGLYLVYEKVDRKI